jgi:chorismate-pyruvate lyase
MFEWGKDQVMHSLIDLNGAAHARSRHDVPLTIVERAVQPLKRSPLQRVLLVTDGTVTEILEAYTGESMRLVKLLEEVVTLDEPLPGLELHPGDQALRRQILLQGKMTLSNFIYGDSYIALDRLDDNMRRALLESHKPIGFLIQEQRMETYREILGVGRELAGPLGQYFGVDTTYGMIWRTYRVFFRGQPIMQISEKFPESQFVD